MAKKDLVPPPSTEQICAAVLEAIRQAPEPMTAAQVSKRVSPFKLTEKKLSPALEVLVSSGVVHSIPAATAKGKPRYWDRDVTEIARVAITNLLGQIPDPLSAKEIAGKLDAPIKFSERDVNPILDELVASHSLYLLPAKTAAGKPRFWSRDLREFVRVSILKLLNAKGPQSLVDLKKGIKGLGDSQFQQYFDELVAERAVAFHPPLGKKGKPLFGSRPPAPEPYLKDWGSTLTQIVTELRSANVPVESLRRALIQLIEAAGIPFGQGQVATAKPVPTETGPKINLVELMRRVEPEADRGALVPPARLRREARIGKTDFDRAVLDLAATGRISLHRHDYVASLTPSERDELVTDGSGIYYVGLALRQNNEHV